MSKNKSSKKCKIALILGVFFFDYSALKGILGLDKKLAIKDIEKLSMSWKGWEAYATF
ncbi:hypothetical protein G9F71_009205 [Clostridium sp. FP2]|uniref:hypothetical protein n=1 Tax=Clostridium TaxID=1485 RepID=UPI0013E99C78|nr:MULTISPECIES: hypothetical protein [Clostridium]MBU3128822.1 hypothetical protein [Clostridium tagluense]MBZ9623033.1 hypothetical protein [Clostridium sp. FP2]